MITPSYAITATERVLPRLALDFTTASLDPRITFARANNTATCVNSNGYIENINADLPRFDYNPVSKVIKGLLIEQSAQNVCLRTEQFNVSPWVLTAATIVQDTVDTLSPRGNNTAAALFETTATSAHVIVQAAISLSTQVCLSIFLKANGRNFAFFGNAEHAVSVNLTNGVVSAAIGTTTILPSVDFGNGWYRVAFTATYASNTGINIYTSTDGVFANRSFAGDSTKGVFVFGSQIETGAFATSYIPTTTTALTRNADVATMTGTNFSNWFNQSEGAFELEYSRIANGVAGKFPYAAYVFQDAQNRIDFYQNATTNDVVTVKTANVSVASFARSVVGANVTVNQVLAYKTNSFAFASGGSSVSTSSSGNLPSPTVLYIGGINSTGFELNGHVKKINYWPLRITNSEVQSFSK